MLGLAYERQLQDKPTGVLRPIEQTEATIYKGLARQLLPVKPVINGNKIDSRVLKTPSFLLHSHTPKPVAADTYTSFKASTISPHNTSDFTHFNLA